MSVIYKITFPNKDFYIGQTTNYAKRKANHLSTKGNGSPKLEEAFKNGEPVFEILEECAVEYLDAKEHEYIQKLKPNLNILPGGNGLKGLNHPRTKYTRKQILEVVDLFLNTTTKYSQIAELTGVKIGMVHDVCRGRAHVWATEGLCLEQAVASRKLIYKVYSPYNELFEANTLAELSEITGLTTSALTSLRANKKKSNNAGWTIEPKEQIKLLDPLGNTHILYQPQAKKLLEKYDLSRYQINQVLSKKKPSGGWIPIT